MVGGRRGVAGKCAKIEKGKGGKGDAFAPPRRRVLAATAAAVAAQNRPSGKAFAKLIFHGPSATQEHSVLDSTDDLAHVLLRRAHGPPTVDAVSNFLLSPDVVISRCSDALAEIRQIPTNREPFRLKRAASHPPESPAKGINFPSAQMMARQLEFPENSL